MERRQTTPPGMSKTRFGLEYQRDADRSAQRGRRLFRRRRRLDLHQARRTRRSYTSHVQALMRFQPLNHGLMAVLIGLLALGPFLHGHLGVSSVSGFHLDGLHTLTHPHEAGAVHSISAPDDESPAVGVATALPKSDDDTSHPLLVPGLPSAVLRLPLQPLAGRPWQAAAELQTVHTYREGWPPPALAPPPPTD